MGSTADHGLRANAPGDVSSAGSGVSDRRFQAGSAGRHVTVSHFHVEAFITVYGIITILKFSCKKVSKVYIPLSESYKMHVIVYLVLT